MFPLRQRILIRGAAAHVRAGLDIGADYRAYHVPLYAPFPGKIETYWGSQGGNWLRLIRDNGDKIEFAHLSKYLYKAGRVSTGEQIAVTGNTGAVTDYPHLHIQIFNRLGRRLDPETYDWGKGYMNPKVRTQKRGSELSINIPAESWEDYVALCKYFGKDPNHIDITI